MSKLTAEQKSEILKIAVDVAHKSEVCNRWRIGSLYVYFLDLIENLPAINPDFKEAYYEARDLFELREVQEALEFAHMHPEFVYGSEPSKYMDARDKLTVILNINARAVNQGLFKYFSDKCSTSDEERQ